MKNFLNLLFYSVILVSLFSCSPRSLAKPFNEAKIQQLYSDCIEDAAKPQTWEVSNKLIQVSDSNSTLNWKEINGEKYLLVSSWKAETKYYKNNEESGMYNTGKYPIWVTTAPELQRLCQVKNFGRKEGLDLRLKQILGLPPDTEKNYFVEFWVKPSDLFRPCPDAEITDVHCGLAFPEEISKEHQDWINNLRLDSYYNAAWNKNYPWTQLGYTYDWNPKSKDNYGLSEFVIGQNSKIVVGNIYTTEEYCQISK